MLEFLGRTVDTQLDDPFCFLEDGRPFVIGRSQAKNDSCDLRIRGPEISSEHCEVLYERGTWWARDRDSTNGTWVDRVRLGLEPVRLVDESEVVIGGVRLRFRRPEGVGESLVRELCEDPTTGLPNDCVLAQACSRAARRDPPAHLALFAPADSQREGGARDLGMFFAALRHVAAPTTPPFTFVGHTERHGATIGVLFRRVEHAQAVELAGAWLALLAERPPFASANCALVSLRGPNDRPLRRAREKLVACELAGNGVLSAQDLDLEWCRDDVARLRRAIDGRSHRWFAVGVRTGGGGAVAQEDERIRGSLARAAMRLPSGSKASIAWQARSSLWFVAVDADRDAFTRLLSEVSGVRFAHAESPGPDWIDARTAELVAGLPVDVSRMSTPLVQLLAAGATGTADRLLQGARRFEAALRLLAVIATAKLANDFTEAGGNQSSSQAFDAALDKLIVSRGRSEGAGSYLALLTGLMQSLPAASTITPIADLLRGDWRKRASAACGERNQAIHLGHLDLAALVPKMEQALQGLAHSLVSPEFQLADVASVWPRRNGGGRLDFVRLVGAIAHPTETIDRTDFTDPGVWLIVPGGSWIRLFPWVLRRACHECGVHDIFVASPLTAGANRPIRYRSMHGHEFQERVADDDATLEFRTLLHALEMRAPTSEPTTG